jgi:homopolymeric O-antigen transport system permease protein
VAAHHPSVTLSALLASLTRHHELLWQLTRRDVAGRYRGSMLGLLWSFFNPVLMLAVYTFVFGMVLRAQWAEAQGGHARFAAFVFAGMIVHGLFAECVNRAPALVLGNPSYVKKVVFPLEVLPWTVLGSALFHAGVSASVLVVFLLATEGRMEWTALALPAVLAPLALFTLGVSWFLASLGVYLRDVAQTTGLITAAMMFLSPVFYPISAVPQAVRPLLYLNPLTPAIEQARQVLLLGQLPGAGPLLLQAAAGVATAWAGFWWFQRTRRGFADVV